MSSSTDASSDPATTEPKLSQQDTESATNPKDAADEPSAGEAKPASYTEMATNAASSATSAAAGVKDNVFSMFGGGAKKEKQKADEEEADEPSGSSKAKKDAEGDAEASTSHFAGGILTKSSVLCRTKLQNHRRSTSSLLST